jgi:hypothetical protein
VWPTKPWPSIPVIPASGGALVVGDVVVDEVVGDPDVVVTVSVVVLADGGTARLVGRDGLLSSPLEINNDASTAATPNSAITATASATCVLPKRLFRGGAPGPGGTDGCNCGGYGVYPVPAGFS